MRKGFPANSRGSVRGYLAQPSRTMELDFTCFFYGIHASLISMTGAAWKRFREARNRYKREIENLTKKNPGLLALQQKLVEGRGAADSSAYYSVETPLVYNSALDDINADSDIKLILVADNPGRREQMAENRRYLVGPSGKIAEKFFRDNPSLKIDFRKNVIILNKTPIHTPRTVELKELRRLGGADLEQMLDQSQRFMARLLLEFHEALASDNGKQNNGKRINGAPPVWICGYSEMKHNGVFAAYTDELKTLYAGSALFDSVFLYRHFSMNQFTIDLKQKAAPGESLRKTLARIGKAYREQFLQ